jgi:hypothetical protein
MRMLCYVAGTWSGLCAGPSPLLQRQGFVHWASVHVI